MIKVGIVGCGAIGSEIAETILKGEIEKCSLSGVFDVDKGKALDLLKRLSLPDSLFKSLQELIADSDLILEATTKSSMPDIAKQALEAGRDVLAMSVGGVVDTPELPKIAADHGAAFYFPSGALGGIDAVLAAKEAGLNHAELITTKHPRSLQGAPYLLKNNVSLDGLVEPRIIFEGSAREAIEGFPANANVAITLSLAGIGMDLTKVRIIADPSCQKTRQEIIVEGDMGTIRSVTESVTSPNNPRTGYLAILSAIATLRRISCRVQIGT